MVLLHVWVFFYIWGSSIYILGNLPEETVHTLTVLKVTSNIGKFAIFSYLKISSQTPSSPQFLVAIFPWTRGQR